MVPMDNEIEDSHLIPQNDFGTLDIERSDLQNGFLSKQERKMTESTFKLTKRERAILEANRRDMETKSTEPVPSHLRPSMAELELQRIVSVCSRWERHIGWRPGQQITDWVHGQLVNAKVRAWQTKAYFA